MELILQQVFFFFTTIKMSWQIETLLNNENIVRFLFCTSRPPNEKDTGDNTKHVIVSVNGFLLTVLSTIIMLWFGPLLLQASMHKPNKQKCQSKRLYEPLTVFMYEGTLLGNCFQTGFKTHHNIMSNDPFYNKFKWASEKTKQMLKAGTNYTSFPKLAVWTSQSF